MWGCGGEWGFGGVGSKRAMLLMRFAGSSFRGLKYGLGLGNRESGSVLGFITSYI